MFLEGNPEAVLCSHRRYESHPICGELQDKILQCYREHAQETLSCSALASQYLHCVNHAKQVSWAYSHWKMVERWEEADRIIQLVLLPCPNISQYVHSQSSVETAWSWFKCSGFHLLPWEAVVECRSSCCWQMFPVTCSFSSKTRGLNYLGLFAINMRNSWMSPTRLVTTWNSWFLLSCVIQGSKTALGLLSSSFLGCGCHCRLKSSWFISAA